MCYQIKTTESKVPLTAKRRIFCKKVFYSDLRSSFQKFQYEKDTIYYQDEYWPEFEYRDINKGFHSYKLDCSISLGSTEIILNCIIPKGAKYFSNDYEFVANQIIIPSEIKLT